MRLLIITQKVDKNDSILGFFHRWIEEFAKHCEKLIVICLEEGEHNLPKNVEVYSLGKEKLTAKSYKLKAFIKIKYIFNFYKLIVRLRNSYDSVFVHMNQEYVLLTGVIWRLMGKKIYLWRNHAKGSILTHMAVILSHKVFATSPHSYTAKFTKTKIMPAGIDVDFFKNGDISKKRKNSILFFGRISPVKNIDLFVKALLKLDTDGFDFIADIVGSPANKRDIEYEKELKVLAQPLVEKGKLSFLSAIPYKETPALYKRYDLYVNLTPEGSFDKTILEAMASGTPVLTSNSALIGHIPDSFILKGYSLDDIINKINKYFTKSSIEIQDLDNKLETHVEKHSLKFLSKEVFKNIETLND